MIPFDFDYYRVDDLSQAIDLFFQLDSENKNPIYYGGGTEIISMARVHNRHTQAVIDIKSIPECKEHGLGNGQLTIGAATSFRDIALKNHFPLLSSTVKRVADHTIQGKISLGGNLAGTIIYKESILPLLLGDAKLRFRNRDGERIVPVMDVFDERLKLARGELLVQAIIEEEYLQLPYLHRKRTKNEKIDYPLITLAGLMDRGQVKIALSGLCESPFRLLALEKYLNDGNLSRDEKIRKFIENVPYQIIDDLSGSGEYRKFVLHKMLDQTLEYFQEVI